MQTLVRMDLSSVMASPSYGKAMDTYKKAVAAAAAVTAYTVLARSMTRELLPDELRRSARWAASILRGRLLPRPSRTKTIFIARHGDGSHVENRLYWDARAYLATRIDVDAMDQLCLSVDSGGSEVLLQQQLVSVVPGDSMTDVFEGVEFTWELTAVGASLRRRGGDDGDGDYWHRGNRLGPEALALSFDVEHMEVALRRYVPSILAEMEEKRGRERTLKIFMNQDRMSWEGFSHNHPATFDTVAFEPELKQSIIADLDRFLGRREYYRRIGKAWKRGYLLYGPPGTGKSSLVAAMANYLRFNLYDLDLSYLHSDVELQKLLIAMPNKSILVIEDIDCCFSANSREGAKQQEDVDKDGDGDSDSESHFEPPPPRASYFPGPLRRGVGITLSRLLNCIDGLWSTSGEERIIVFTTNYKERLDPALLRPGRMDMHVYMGYCGWEAVKTLAHNYFLVDDHALFPEIQALLAEVEVTPAEASEMLLRSEDADVALQGFVEFLQGKKMKMQGRRDRKI